MEVIIAITILSLVAIPVLHSMTTSMYYNAKARTRQSVTLSAESLMETFKGYDLEELKVLFANAASGDASAKADLGVTDADGFEYPSDLSAGELNFKVNGMKSDDGKTSCDVEIKAVRQGEVEVMEIDNILPTRDAIFRGDRGWDTQAVIKAQDDFSANHIADFLTELDTLDERDRVMTLSDVDLSCLTLYQRDLTFTISNDGTNDIVTAKMEYTYYIKHHKYYEKEEPASTEESPEGEAGTTEAASTETVTYIEQYFDYPSDVADYFTVAIPLDSYAPAAAVGEYTIYTNPVDGGVHPLQRILLYYYPVYNMKDNILVKNSAGLSLDCYMIKQKAADMTNASLTTSENNYKPNVSGIGTSNVILYHNFKTNLGGSGGSTPGASHITSFQAVEEYAGSAFKKNKVLVYKIEMKVFTNGTEVASFEGTMNEYMD